MINQSNVHQFTREDGEYTFIYNTEMKLMQIAIYDLVTKDRFKGKYIHDSLPYLLNALFDDTQQLYTHITTIPKENISFTSEDYIHSITIIITVLGKEKISNLPLHYIRSSDARIQQQRDKIKKVCQDNRRLTVQLRAAQQKIERLQRQLKYKEDKIQDLQQQLLILEAMSKKRSLSQSQPNAPMLVPSKSSYKLTLDCTEYQQTLMIRQEEIFKFTTNIPTSSMYFLVEGTKIIVKEQFKDFHQVVAIEPLSLKQRNVVKIRLNKSSRNNIYFGIMKQQRKFERYTCQHQSCITYKLAGGKFIWEDGKQSGEQICKIKIGNVLCMIMDPIKQQLTWFVQKVFMFKRFLPSNFHNVPLYPFVSMHDVGDQVQFL